MATNKKEVMRKAERLLERYIKGESISLMYSLFNDMSTGCIRFLINNVTEPHDLMFTISNRKRA